MSSTDEQQFTILWQWPEGIIDNEFEFVNLTTNAVKEWCNRVVIGNSFLTLVCNAVGDLACSHKFFDLCLDTAGTFGYLFDELEVTGTECIGLIAGNALCMDSILANKRL